MKQKEIHKKIASGQCVSPLTVERCPYCVDSCDASHFKSEIQKAKMIAENRCEICGSINGKSHNLVDGEICNNDSRNDH